MRRNASSYPVLDPSDVTTKAEWHAPSDFEPAQENGHKWDAGGVWYIGLKRYIRYQAYTVSVTHGVGKSGMLDKWTSGVTETKRDICFFKLISWSCSARSRVIPSCVPRAQWKIHSLTEILTKCPTHFHDATRRAITILPESYVTLKQGAGRDT